jgi:ferredoxin
MTIIYFSATGNSKYVATRLAKDKDRLIFIPDAIRNGNFEIKDDSIGIVSPTYFWGLPSIVKEFFQKATFHADYLYFVATYGTTPGSIGVMARKLIKGKKIDSFYSVRMVDTYTPIFDISTKRKQDKFTKHTEEEIDKIIESIAKKEYKTKMNGQIPSFITNAISQPLYENKKRLTSRLFVNENCIGCGLCARKCPINAIEMIDKKPVWVKEKCVMCLGCLHRCSKFAIECGKKTKNHGQYQNPYAKI